MSAKNKSSFVGLVLALVLISTIYLIPTGLAGPPYYRDYRTFMNDFKELVGAYPSVASYETIGRSVDNQDIIMFKIGNPNGGRVLFDGAMHGTENLGSELLYYYAEWLLTSNEPLAEQVLAEDYTLIIAILNIEGMQMYTRKNANGVDLNRNFATNWESGTSDPNSDVYRGPSPLSESESQILMKVFNSYKPQFYVNLHMWAGPYYAGSTYADRAYYSTLVQKISSLSSSRDVTPFRYNGEFRGAGMAISDAARIGITSFLIELGSTIYSSSEIERTLLPRFIPMACVLSQECTSTSETLSGSEADVNRDGKVDLLDIFIVSSAFSSTPGSPTWDERADVNSDEVIDLQDLFIVGRHSGEDIPSLVMPFDIDLSPIAKDFSGYDNNGIVTGATWTSDGAIGGGYIFDGNDFITVPDDSSLGGNGDWGELSIEFWIQPSALLRGTRLVAKKAASDSTGSYIVGFQTSTSVAANTLFFGAMIDGKWEEIIFGEEPLQVGTWYHVVCTYRSGQEILIYINGEPKISRPLMGKIDSGSGDEPLFIGYDGGGGANRYFVGMLDEVKVSNSFYSAQIAAPDNMWMGVSYSSNGQHYTDTSDAVLDQDFRLFRDKNIKIISLNVVWAAIEPGKQGAYDSTVVNNLKRVLTKAEKYNLGVLFSFHTHFQEQADPYQTPWHLPSYVVDPYTGKKITLAIVRSDEMKRAFLNYVQNVVSQVKESTAIEIWSLLNEPMYWWDYGLPTSFSHKQSFQQLMVEGKKLIGTLDSRPVTVKFALPDSPWSSDFDLATIMQIMDNVFALNVYIDPATGKDDWGMTLDDFNRAVADCKGYGKELWITEFGKSTLNNDVQSTYYDAAISIFQNGCVHVVMAWTWIHDQTGMSDYDRSWSICYNGGEPRPAFYKLSNGYVE